MTLWHGGSDNRIYGNGIIVTCDNMISCNGMMVISDDIISCNGMVVALWRYDSL